MMPARFARWSLLLLAIILFAIWLPQAHNKLFEYRFGKTHLFYSPVAKTFIYKELLGEGHQFVYRDREGNNYSREQFETLIPFIYYKNMDLWGKLPLELDGNSFDIQTIRKERQVMELKPVELTEYNPRIQLFPLLESNPGRARLRFPENVFRPGDSLEFIDSDHNHPTPSHDESGDHDHPTLELTEDFSAALTVAGFQFPVTATYGQVSILKAFDAGYFLVDNQDRLYHLIRKDGHPTVWRVALPDSVKVRFIKVTENKRRETVGFLLDQENKLHIISYSTYQLIPLNLPGYNPDTMELKIIFNPLYRTTIYSDQENIYAVAMDKEYRVIDSFSRTMAMAAPRLPDQIRDFLSPFRLELRDPNSRYFAMQLIWNGNIAIFGSIAAMLLAVAYLRLRGYKPFSHPVDIALVLLSGFYGLIALILLPPDND